MKRWLVVAAVFFCTHAFAQTPYTYTNNGTSVVLNGLISKYILLNDPAFSWFETAIKSYQPDQRYVAALEAAKNKYTFLVFGGTWCDDTRVILPKFFALQEKSGISDQRITLVGVDNAKKSIGNLATVMNITNVPTVIVLENGKEVGRVVEYGSTGIWEDALLALFR